MKKNIIDKKSLKINKLLILGLVFLALLSCTKKDKKEIKYYPNGNIEWVFNLVNDKCNGESVKYYSSGEVEVKIEFKDGLRYGNAVRYNKNGSIQYIRKFENDTIQEISFYNEHKKIYVKEIYEKGRIKIKINFDNDGFVNKKESYVNNKLVGYEKYSRKGNVIGRSMKIESKVINKGNKVVGDNYIYTVKLLNPVNDCIKVIFLDCTSNTWFIKTDTLSIINSSSNNYAVEWPFKPDKSGEKTFCTFVCDVNINENGIKEIMNSEPATFIFSTKK